jgi:hypothetical protein
MDSKGGRRARPENINESRETCRNPRFAAIADELSAQSRIESRASFNRYCQEACRHWNGHFGDGVGKTSAHFTALLSKVDEGGRDVIKTPWAVWSSNCTNTRVLKNTS